MDKETALAHAHEARERLASTGTAVQAIELGVHRVMEQLRSCNRSGVVAARVNLCPGDMTEYRLLIIAPVKPQFGQWRLVLENAFQRRPLMPLVWEPHLPPGIEDVLDAGWHVEPWTATVVTLFVRTLSVALMAEVW